MSREAAALFSLFLGSDVAFGKSYYTGKVSDVGKREAKCWTEKTPLTLDDWEGHVKGTCGIGVIPINSSNMVTWGVIDVDIYGLEFTEFYSDITKKGLPLVPCRSKSGGLHLFLFCKDWIPAEEMMAKLDSLAAMLGLGSCEIFPKQSAIRVEEGREDYGNWINMPYFGGTDRQGVGPDGENIPDILSFVAYAESKRLSSDEFKAFNPAQATNRVLPDGPPCLNIMWEKNSHEGHRKILLANTCVYLKKAHPEDWGAKLEELNRTLTPPLPSREIEDLKSSYSKKDYRYQCQDCNLKKFCNAMECKKRQFGISVEDNGGVLVNNRSLTKILTDPPTWFLDVRKEDGTHTRMSLATAELQNPRNFQFRCMEALNIMPPLVKNEDWQPVVASLLEHVSEVPVPPEATPKGRFYELLEEYLEHRDSENLDCVKRGVVFDDIPGGWLIFRLSDLDAFLLQKRFTLLKTGKIVSALRDIGAFADKRRIGESQVRIWAVPREWIGLGEEPLTVTIKKEEEPF